LDRRLIPAAGLQFLRKIRLHVHVRSGQPRQRRTENDHEEPEEIESC
jgi:hypothetical protein